MPDAKSVGIWVRVSTEDQVRGESPKHHELRARAYAESRGWQVVTVYDPGEWSGKTVKDHPECKRMLADIASGRISGLIFSKLARLARNTQELLTFADYFERHRAGLISLQEAIDTSTPAGRLFYTIIAAMAQWEREEIAARVAASIPIRAKLGKPLGGVSSFGYRWQDKKLLPDPVEAPVRRLMYELFLDLRRVDAVARELNSRGYRTRTGHPWNHVAVTRLLEDPTAMGRRRANFTKAAPTGSGKPWEFKPESDWVWHDVEAIVTPEIWQQVNTIRQRQKNGRKPTRRAKHLFTGISFCHCGHPLYVPSSSPTKYVCLECRNKIPIADLEAVFREQLRGMFASDEGVQQVIQQADENLKDREALLAAQQVEAAKLSGTMDQIMDLYLAGSISKDGFKERFGPLEDRRNQLRDEVPRLMGQIDYLKVGLASRDQILREARDLYEHWENLTADEKRCIVENVAERITLGKGDISFEMCFRPASLETAAEAERIHGDPFSFCRVSRSASKPPSEPCPAQPRTLGEHVLRRRLEMRLRVMDVAELIGVDSQVVTAWEHGVTEPCLRLLPAIFDFLGYCPAEPRARSLGERLSLWRMASGVSRQALADRLGLDSTTLWLIETRPDRRPSRHVRESVEHLLARRAP